MICLTVLGTLAQINPVITPAAVPFALEDVRLLPGPFQDAMLRNKTYLLSLNADRFLYVFRSNYGLPASGTPYGGWDSPTSEQRGCSLGHYLSACALLYASTGDAALKAQADYLVAELAKCQAAAINGTAQCATGASGSYAPLTRTWQNGDQVEGHLPLTLRTEELPGDQNTVALLCGPVLLAGMLGTNGMRCRNAIDVGLGHPVISHEISEDPTELWNSTSPSLAEHQV